MFATRISYKSIVQTSKPLCSLCQLAQYPSFLSEPASLVQSRGSIAILHCLVRPPSAVVSWLFRGLPLNEPSLPGVRINATSLTIASLQESHTGVYQCVARVGHGPAVASRLAHVAIAGTDGGEVRPTRSLVERLKDGKKERKQP